MPAMTTDQVFTVRVGAERLGAGVQYRGSVRAVRSGAFRNFREWSDLTSFLAQHLEEDDLHEVDNVFRMNANKEGT